MADLTADLAEPLRTNVRGLIKESGGVVTISSGRRTKEQQAALRVKNGCPDVYRAPASSCRVATAIPGSSKHEQGEAVDFTNTDRVLREVERLAAKYRIHRTVPSERWHYESAVGSAHSASVLDPGALVAGAGSMVGGLPVVGSAQAIGTFFALLSNGSTWIRVAEVLGGAVFLVLGFAVLASQTTAVRSAL